MNKNLTKTLTKKMQAKPEEKEESKLTMLLKGFSPEDQEQLKVEFAKTRLKLKILSTLMYKEKVYEDFSLVEKRKYLCQEKCYKKLDLKQPDSLAGQTESLQSCVKNCSMATEDVKNYLENTDFMSIFKLEYCADGCFSQTKPGTTERLDCYFDCYARLDRRYRGYWLKHRNKLINRYYHQLYEEEPN